MRKSHTSESGPPELTQTDSSQNVRQSIGIKTALKPQSNYLPNQMAARAIAGSSVAVASGGASHTDAAALRKPECLGREFRFGTPVG